MNTEKPSTIAAGAIVSPNTSGLCFEVPIADAMALTNMLQTLMAFWLYCEVPEVDLAGVQLITNNIGKLGERFPD